LLSAKLRSPNHHKMLAEFVKDSDSTGCWLKRYRATRRSKTRKTRKPFNGSGSRIRGPVWGSNPFVDSTFFFDVVWWVGWLWDSVLGVCLFLPSAVHREIPARKATKGALGIAAMPVG
jgi:hypothetical protein